MITKYIQDSLVVTDGKISIQVPTMDGEIEYNGLVYNVGAWLYTQIRMNYLGLLSKNRIAKLKKISLYKYEYDEAGNIINTYATKFNALDKDVYDKEIFDTLCSIPYEQYTKNTLFRFNRNGLFDPEGENIIALMDEDMYLDSNSSLDEWIYNDQSGWEQTLFRENYVLFKNGCLDLETPIETSICNITRIHNEDASDYVVKILCHKNTETTVRLFDDFSKQYIISIAKEYMDANKVIRDGVSAYIFDENETLQKILKHIEVYYLEATTAFKIKPNENIVSMDYDEAERKLMLQMLIEALDYGFSDKLLYEENLDAGLDAIIKFNPLLLKDAYETKIHSTLLTGKECNAYLDKPYGYETRRGLKIPRMKYEDHETYVIIFKNGELIDSYSDMIATANYFFLPVKGNFNNSDEIELLYFTDVNNNEIHFMITENMISNFKDCVDERFKVLDMFEPYIKHDEIKYFCKYPSQILLYKDVIEESNDIAFNVTYRDEDGNVLVFKDALMREYLNINPREYLSDLIGVVPLNGVIPSSVLQQSESSTRSQLEVTNEIIEDIDIVQSKSYHNEFIAVSGRKFVYERLHVDAKAYRIKMDRRFRYCDNQKQYILFINGRRINDDSFFVTTPKYTRPFWGIYLYVTKFVNPDDRIEIFYVPEELNDANIDDHITLNKEGYIQSDKQLLSMPLSNALYLFFINGKKIANGDLKDVCSFMLRATKDIKTLKHIIANPIYQSVLPEMEKYMHSDELSTYDSIIQYVRDDTTYLGYGELDKLFDTYVKMSDIESDRLVQDVARIAIINEIVRDFWVTSGYQYNTQPFVYDYELDEIIVRNDDGNYILPALDANPRINIPKTDIHLLYFYTEPESLVYEIGSTLIGIKFFWEYSQGIFTNSDILSQKINDTALGVDDRTYEYYKPIKEDTSFKFVGTTYNRTLTHEVDVKFYNGIYYGSIDEDSLQNFQKTSIEMLQDLIAIISNNGYVPSSDELDGKGKSISDLKAENTVVSNLSDMDGTLVETKDNEWPNGVVNINDLVAVCIDGRTFKGGTVITNSSGDVIEYKTETDLQYMLSSLNCSLQGTIDLSLENYVIGSNNYFVFAAPKRLIIESGIEFVMPDVHSREVIDHGKDDHTTPVYTNGLWDEQHCLVELDNCEMVRLGEFYYINPSGYGETYVAYRSNGFFTRQYDDYGFDIVVRTKE
jgi:hypothetical protein